MNVSTHCHSQKTKTKGFFCCWRNTKSHWKEIIHVFKRWTRVRSYVRVSPYSETDSKCQSANHELATAQCAHLVLWHQHHRWYMSVSYKYNEVCETVIDMFMNTDVYECIKQDPHCTHLEQGLHWYVLLARGCRLTWQGNWMLICWQRVPRMPLQMYIT